MNEHGGVRRDTPRLLPWYRIAPGGCQTDSASAQGFPRGQRLLRDMKTTSFPVPGQATYCECCINAPARMVAAGPGTKARGTPSAMLYGGRTGAAAAWAGSSANRPDPRRAPRVFPLSVSVSTKMVEAGE